MVGSRGEKRLLLQPSKPARGRGRGRGAVRGGQPTRGGQQPPRGRGRGQASSQRERGGRAATRAATQANEELEVDMEETEEEAQHRPAAAGSQKRRADGGPAGQPPEKR